MRRGYEDAYRIAGEEPLATRNGSLDSGDYRYTLTDQGNAERFVDDHGRRRSLLPSVADVARLRRVPLEGRRHRGGSTPGEGDGAGNLPRGGQRPK